MDASQISNIADQLKYYDGAESFVLGMVGNLATRFNDISYYFAWGSAILALSWYLVRIQMVELFRWFVFFVVIVVAVIPVRADEAHGGAKVSVVLYYLNKFTTDMLLRIQGEIDTAMGYGDSKPGNFATTNVALAAIANDYGKGMNDSPVARVQRDFAAQCVDPLLGVKRSGASSVASGLQEINGDTARILAALRTPRAGVLGRGLRGTEINRLPPDHDNLTTLPSSVATILAKTPVSPVAIRSSGSRNGYQVETSESIRKRLQGAPDVGRGGSTAGSLMVNAYPELAYSRDGEASGLPPGDLRTDTFYPTNCYEMFQLADLGWRQYVRAATQDSIGFIGRAYDKLASLANDPMTLSGQISLAKQALGGGGPTQTFCPVDVASLGASEVAFNQYQDAISGGASGVGDYIGSRVTSGAVSLASSLFEWFTKWGVIVGMLAMPTVASFSVGAIFVMFPFIVAFSLLPNRSTMLVKVLLTIVFIKLTLLLSYFALKVGGSISVAAICETVATKADSLGLAYAFGSEGLTSNIRGAAFTGLIITYIFALAGAPWAAFHLTFNEHHGLMGLGFNKFGTRQMVQAGASAVYAASAASKGASNLTGGLRKPSGGGDDGSDGGGGSPQPPRTPPSTRGGSIGGGGGVTSGDIGRRISRRR